MAVLTTFHNKLDKDEASYLFKVVSTLLLCDSKIFSSFHNYKYYLFIAYYGLGTYTGSQRHTPEITYADVLKIH